MAGAERSEAEATAARRVGAQAAPMAVAAECSRHTCRRTTRSRGTLGTTTLCMESTGSTAQGSPRRSGNTVATWRPRGSSSTQRGGCQRTQSAASARTMQTRASPRRRRRTCRRREELRAPQSTGRTERRAEHSQHVDSRELERLIHAKVNDFRRAVSGQTKTRAYFSAGFGTEEYRYFSIHDEGWGRRGW